MLFRAILIGGLLTAGAWAQNEESTTEAPPERPPLTVDRPSFGNSANVVGDGIVQLESGFLAQSFKEAGSVPLYNFPQRLRVGLSEDFELRLDTNFLSFQGGNSGLDDWAPGFKYNFARSDNYKLSILGTLEIPSATNPAFRTSQVNGGLSLIGDFPLDELTYINVNGGFLTPVDGLGNRAVQPFGTFYVGRTLSDSASGYVEFAVFGEGPAGCHCRGRRGELHSQSRLRHRLRRLQRTVRRGAGLGRDHRPHQSLVAWPWTNASWQRRADGPAAFPASRARSAPGLACSDSSELGEPERSRLNGAPGLSSRDRLLEDRAFRRDRLPPPPE